MANKKNLVVTLADEKYILQAKQLFSSIYWNAGWDGDYLLLAHNIPKKELKWFIEKGIIIKDCQPLTDNSWGKNGDFFQPLIADKFYLFTEEFKKWETIIYIDSDIIIKGPLSIIAKTKKIAAVSDLFYRKLEAQYDIKLKSSNLLTQINLNKTAFNAGMFAFKTDVIYPNLFNDLTCFLNNYNDGLIYGEQSTFNYFFYKKWQKLPIIYNVYVNYLNFNLPKWMDCIALHFAKRENHPILWDKKNKYYHEWKSNLDKADLIELNSIQKVKKWSYLKIQFYSISLKIIFQSVKLKLSIINYFKTNIIPFYKYLIGTPDRSLGKIGSLLKKTSPYLYYKIKKYKDGR